MNHEELIQSVVWHHRFEIAPGMMTPGRYNPNGLFKRLELPETMEGLRVLDIGARDGFFSFECEKRGAEVLAIDYLPAEEMGFEVARRILGSSVEFRQANLYELPELKLPPFDIVLCLGVVYHVPDPYLAFEILKSLVKNAGRVLLEANNLDEGFTSVDGREQRFPDAFSQYPAAIFTRSNPTNYWCMNRRCLEALASDTGFQVSRVETWGKRILMDMTSELNREKERILRLARGRGNEKMTV